MRFIHVENNYRNGKIYEKRIRIFSCLGVYNGENVSVLGGLLHLLLSDLAALLLSLSFTEGRKSKRSR
jgi:hypothetical protein